MKPLIIFRVPFPYPPRSLYIAPPCAKSYTVLPANIIIHTSLPCPRNGVPYFCPSPPSYPQKSSSKIPQSLSPGGRDVRKCMTLRNRTVNNHHPIIASHIHSLIDIVFKSCGQSCKEENQTLPLSMSSPLALMSLNILSSLSDLPLMTFSLALSSLSNFSVASRRCVLFSMKAFIKSANL